MDGWRRAGELTLLPNIGVSRSIAVAASIVIAVAIGGAFVLATGGNPVAVFTEIVTGSLSGNNLGRSLNRAIPLVGMAIVVALPLRAGIVNLGGDGQLLLGALAAACIALYLPAPGGVRIVAAILAAILAGAGYAALAAILQTALKVPFLIGTLLLSYVAIGFTSYLVRFPLRDTASGLPETARILPDARLPGAIFGLQVSVSLVLMTLVVLAVVINDRRGVFGLDIRMRGSNEAFARYSGLRLARQTIVLAATSGGIAGLVGALIVLGEQFRFTDGAILVANYTWSGLLAAILAMANPIATVVAAAFFAALQVGGFSVERTLGLPSILTQILQALIILCLAMRGGFGRRR